MRRRMFCCVEHTWRGEEQLVFAYSRYAFLHRASPIDRTHVFDLERSCSSSNPLANDARGSPVARSHANETRPRRTETGTDCARRLPIVAEPAQDLSPRNSVGTKCRCRPPSEMRVVRLLADRGSCLASNSRGVFHDSGAALAGQRCRAPCDHVDRPRLVPDAHHQPTDRVLPGRTGACCRSRGLHMPARCPSGAQRPRWKRGSAPIRHERMSDLQWSGFSIRSRSCV
jgi:hypothetical protein